MNKHNSPSSNMTTQFFSRDFRLQYMDLYSVDGREISSVSPQLANAVDEPALVAKSRGFFGIMQSEECPLLSDNWVCFVVGMTVHFRHDFHGRTINENSPSFQGWAERAARSFGLTGKHMPETFSERMALRMKLFGMMYKELHEHYA